MNSDIEGVEASKSEHMDVNGHIEGVEVSKSEH